MVIEKARQIGNCSCLKSNGMSVGMMGMRSTSTSLLLIFQLELVL